MKRETPRTPDGAKLCGWCGGEIKQSGVGRSRDYCSRTHREYAYRARREAEVKLVAYSRGRADARAISSTDARRTGPVPSVDETVSAGPGLPAPATSGDFLLAPPATEWRAADAPAPRRRLSRNRSEAVPLWPSEEFQPPGADGE